MNLKTVVTRKQNTPILSKINISCLMIHIRTCTYQGIRNVNFLENLTFSCNHKKFSRLLDHRIYYFGSPEVCLELCQMSNNYDGTFCENREWLHFRKAFHHGCLIGSHIDFCVFSVMVFHYFHCSNG